MSKKLDDMSALLNATSESVKELFRVYLKSGDISQFRTCCDQRLSAVMQFDPHFNSQITRATSCDVTPTLLSDGSFAPGTNLTDHWRLNLDNWPNLKWQYFMSVWGVHSEYPAFMPFPQMCPPSADSGDFLCMCISYNNLGFHNHN